jgi:hypothetical protein
MPKKSAYAELTVFPADFALILGLGIGFHRVYNHRACNLLQNTGKTISN